MQPLRSQYRGSIDKNILRRSRYGAYDLFQTQTRASNGILTSDVRANIKKSMGNTIQIPVFNSETVTIGTARSCIIPDSENTTQLIGLTFIPFSWGFTMFPAQHFNNQITYEQDFARKMEKYLLAFAAALDSLCVATLNTDRNQYFAGVEAVYPVVGNAIQVSGPEAPDFYNQMSGIMELMDFYGTYDVMANTMHHPLVKRYMNQGGGNQMNDSFQFAGYDYHFSNRIPTNPGVHSTSYIVPKGTVAIENRNDPDSIMGSVAGGGSKRWSQVELPLVNLTVGHYYTDDCRDISALHPGTSNLTRSKVEGHEFSTDICLVTAFNDRRSTTYSPIQKVEISATDLARI